MAVILVIAGGLVFLDQLSKHFLGKFLPLGEPLPLIKNFFQLTLIHNPRGAFGLFRTFPHFFFILLSCLAIIFILFFWKKLSEETRLGELSLGFILGGILGNFIDRLRFGYVVDFLDFGLGSCRWPAFNFADLGISLGIIFLLYKSFEKAKGAE